MPEPMMRRSFSCGDLDIFYKLSYENPIDLVVSWLDTPLKSLSVTNSDNESDYFLCSSFQNATTSAIDSSSAKESNKSEYYFRHSNDSTDYDPDEIGGYDGDSEDSSRSYLVCGYLLPPFSASMEQMTDMKYIDEDTEEETFL